MVVKWFLVGMAAPWLKGRGFNFSYYSEKLRKSNNLNEEKKGLKFNMKLKGKHSLEIGHFCSIPGSVKAILQ